MKTKILITGSNGLLGQKLILALSPMTEVELIATSRGSNRSVVRESYTYLPLDITSAEEVLYVFTQIKPDVVIHTAAMTHVDQCELNPEECNELNVAAVQNVVDACAANHVHLVHLSTDFIFDGTHGPLDEEEMPNPVSIYGHSKLRAEEIVQAKLKSWSILRTMLVYGVADEMSRSNIVLWAKQSLEEGKPIKVVNDQFRTPTLAEDLAQACVLAALKKAEGVFNISGEELFSIAEFVYKIADFWQLDIGLIEEISTESFGQPAKRPPRTGFIIDKAKSILGYRPHSIQRGLQLVDEQLKRREKQ